MSLFKRGELIPTRDGFGRALLDLGAKYSDLAVVSADLEDATRAKDFMKKYPARSFSVGIAEQNMIGVAAGLAATGLKVFANSFAVFLTNRAYDQIRLSVCYNDLPVKMIGSHGGVTVGPDGGSAQSLEDIAIMRVLPGMNVIVPADANEAYRATEALYKLYKPSYMRLSRPSSLVFTDEDEDFVIGRAKILREGDDIALIGCGIILNEVLKAADRLEEEGVMARVINMHTVKPLDRDALLDAAALGAVLVVEEHQKAGGLGGAIAEFLSNENPVIFGQIAVEDSFGESGSPEGLLDKYKLSFGYIERQAKILLKKKLKRSY